jgi:hypothetical protein
VGGFQRIIWGLGLTLSIAPSTPIAVIRRCQTSAIERRQSLEHEDVGAEKNQGTKAEERRRREGRGGGGARLEGT